MSGNDIKKSTASNLPQSSGISSVPSYLHTGEQDGIMPTIEIKTIHDGPKLEIKLLNYSGEMKVSIKEFGIEEILISTKPVVLDLEINGVFVKSKSKVN